MMKYSSEIKSQLQKAVDVMYAAEKFEEEILIHAQVIGLQGEKRKERYCSSKSHNLVNYLKCEAYDVFGAVIRPHHVETPPMSITNFEKYFEISLERHVNIYDELHEIANELVKYHYQPVACLLFCKCKCILDEIRYIKRTLAEGKKAAWSPTWIFTYQTTFENVHDKYEKLESSDYPFN